MRAFSMPALHRPYPGQEVVTTLWYTDFTQDAQLAFVYSKWKETGGTELQGARTLEGLRQIWELAAFAVGIPYEDTSKDGSGWLQEALL